MEDPAPGRARLRSRFPLALLAAASLGGCAERAVPAAPAGRADRPQPVAARGPAVARPPRGVERAAPAASQPMPADPPAPLRASPVTPDEELLREIASGRRAASELVDPARGVDVIQSENGGSDEPVPPPKKRCGREAAAAIKRYADALVAHDDGARALGEGPTLVCAGLACSKSSRGEFDLTVQLLFAREQGRLVLRAIDELDVSLVPEERQTRDAKVHAAAFARLARGRCPG